MRRLGLIFGKLSGKFFQVQNQDNLSFDFSPPCYKTLNLAPQLYTNYQTHSKYTTEKGRENVNADGITDAVLDIRNEFNTVMDDIYRNHVTNPKKREKWSANQRTWMMRRAADLFPACNYAEETLREWIESPNRLNWTSFTKENDDAFHLQAFLSHQGDHEKVVININFMNMIEITITTNHDKILHHHHHHIVDPDHVMIININVQQLRFLPHIYLRVILSYPI